ncbi:hypothetical protein, partial [Mesorhizobium sp. B2-4-13]|uniref:hypothetical protein n=1 Tax=Mesorhizobium sp. B2-4-13 TaxID=2589936 RepID=UPI001AEEDC3D
KQFLHCISPPLLVSGCTDLSGIPVLPGESLPITVSLPGLRLPFAGTPRPLDETDVPERKNQNT